MTGRGPNKHEPLIGQARLAQRMRMEMQCDPQWVMDLAAERDQLRAEVEALRSLFAECAGYLNINQWTSIGHGSILHRKMIDAAMAAKEGQ